VKQQLSSITITPL